MEEESSRSAMCQKESDITSEKSAGHVSPMSTTCVPREVEVRSTASSPAEVKVDDKVEVIVAG